MAARKVKSRDLGPNVVRFPGYIYADGSCEAVWKDGKLYKDVWAMVYSMPEKDCLRTGAWHDRRYLQGRATKLGGGNAA
jgi:hypothetical protein